MEASRRRKEAFAMGMKKQWSTEEKLAVVLDGLKGRPVRELCREYGISDAQYYKWREEAINPGKWNAIGC